MDETKFDPEKIAKRICKLIANSKPSNTSDSVRKLTHWFKRLCAKEKHLVFLHVYVKSQQFELFRSRIDDYNTVLVVLLNIFATSVIGAKLLFKKIPWVIKTLIAFLSDHSTARESTIILSNLAGVYFKTRESKWEAFFEYGIVEVLAQNLWKIEWDFADSYDVQCVLASLNLVAVPLTLQKHSISAKIVSLLKPNLIHVIETFPNDVEDEHDLFVALFKLLWKMVHFDRSILKFVKKTKVIQLTKSCDLRKRGYLQQSVDMLLCTCRREHCKVHRTQPTLHVSVRLNECNISELCAYNDTLKWCAADGCQESSDTCELKRCSGCVDYVTYCSMKCQKSDWNIHKRLCKSLQ